jgi:hypothetical protein
MRALTTAIDEGEHKLPDVKHKVTRYKLAPGEAMCVEPERGVVKVSPEMSKRSEYLYLLSWLENRTVARFNVDGKVLVQPIKNDPQPKRRRDADRDDGRGSGEPAGTPVDESGMSPAGASRDGARSPDGARKERGQRRAGAGTLALDGDGAAGRADQRGAVAVRRKRKGRRPLSRPLDLL